MKRTISSDDLSILNKGFAAAGISLSLEGDSSCFYSVNCNFINNPDGTLRWIWPRSKRSASFLRFYHAGSLRSKAMALLIRMALWLGLECLVRSGKCCVYTNEAGGRLLEKLNDWAVFTGTVGEQRKLVGWYNWKYGSWFAKMPLSKTSAGNIANEIAALNQPSLPAILKPSVEVVNNIILLQSDVYENRHTKIPDTIFDLPVQAFRQWLGNDVQQQVLCTTNWWKAATRKIEELAGNDDKKYNPVLTERLQELMGNFKGDDLALTAPAHGDFTPWNLRYDRNKMVLIDWELFDSNRPVLYDLFHFIYQDNIFIRHRSYSAIRQEIDRYMAQPEWQSFLEENDIDLRQAEQLYLIHTISWYLDLYQRQEAWHVQINWMLDTWCEALGYWLAAENVLMPRQVVLQDMVHHLRNTDYAVLKLEQSDIKLLPATSDVDMCIGRKDAGKLISWLKSHPQVLTLKCRKQSFMNRITMVLHDRSFLHIDLISEIRRKSLVFMNAAGVRQSASVNLSGVKIPLLIHDVTYVWLFHLLNKASIPDKYMHWLRKGSLHRIVCGMVINKYQLNIPAAVLFEYDEHRRGKISRLLHQDRANSRIKYAIHTLQYAWDTLKQLFPQKGYLVTFSGVDGAGKSTVISNLARRVEKEMRMPVVVLRHRPSVLPILSAWRYGKAGAEQRSMESLPRMGNGKPGLMSYCRFAYYFTDYLLGQFYVQLRYVYRGYVVLYDRYYFDFINDSKRSNIIIPSSISYRLYRFLIKPAFNYFLFAPTDIILQRKQELDEQTINMLTRKYLTLFHQLKDTDRKHTYDAVCNINLDTTLETIFTNFKNHRLCAAS